MAEILSVVGTPEGRVICLRLSPSETFEELRSSEPPPRRSRTRKRRRLSLKQLPALSAEAPSPPIVSPVPSAAEQLPPLISRTVRGKLQGKFSGDSFIADIQRRVKGRRFAFGGLIANASFALADILGLDEGSVSEFLARNTNKSILEVHVELATPFLGIVPSFDKEMRAALMHDANVSLLHGNPEALDAAIDGIDLTLGALDAAKDFPPSTPEERFSRGKFLSKEAALRNIRKPLVELQEKAKKAGRRSPQARFATPFVARTGKEVRRAPLRLPEPGGIFPGMGSR